MSGSPVINPASEDEQGQRLPGPRGNSGNGISAPQPVKSPLDLSGADDIIQASGLGAHQNLSKSQFNLPGESGEGAEGAEGAGELGELADLAPLALA